MWNDICEARNRGVQFRRLRFVFGVPTAAIAFFAVLPVLAGAPHWIASANGPEAVPWRCSKSFSIDEPIQGAELRLAADFCHAEVRINGQPALSVEPYCPLQVVEVTGHLRRGRNEVAVAVAPVEGAPAIALSLTLRDPAGNTKTIVSDESWSGAESRGEVSPEQWGIARRSAEISPFDNYEQWRQALGNDADRPPEFWLAAGFEVSRVRLAAPEEGSWIAMAFDAEGRVTISREDTGLLRMTLAENRRSVMQVEPIAVDLPECRGLLYDRGMLFANANNARSLYRLRIDDDGTARDLVLLREFPGGVGHGRNDLALGPDGLLYSIHGDSVKPPHEPIVDRTSPLRESRRGAVRDEGYVVRVDPVRGDPLADEQPGDRWEVLCTGLRNPYGIAFNAKGDLFTYDADNEFDMGTPWYRPTRIVQLVSGADYGYRRAQGRWPPEFPDHPDNGLPTIDVGRGSPTAVLFGTQLNFPAPYREALFALDWAYGRVLAVHMAPRGAGYRAALELFMQGKPLNVTDLAAGPDGALWLITGGRKTQSALYRVTWTEGAVALAPPGRHEREVAEVSECARNARLQLEARHVEPGAADARNAAAQLASADPLIRHAARIVLEKRPAGEIHSRYEAWRAARPTEGELPLRSRLELLSSLVRSASSRNAAPLIDELLTLPAEKLDLSARFAVVFLYSELLARAPEEVASQSGPIVRQLASFWPDPSAEGLRASPHGTNFELRRRIALLLARLKGPDIVDRLAGTLLLGPTQEDRLQGLLALSTTRDGWSRETRRAYFGALRDARQFVGGEGMPTFLDRLRTDALATLDDAERPVVEDLLAPSATDAEPLPPPRPKVASWTLADVRPLADRMAHPGDPRRGETVFREALCSRCHRAGAAGPAVGPDLTFVSRRFGRGDILEAIIEPSRSVAENYRNLSVATAAGKVLVGRLVSAGDFRGEKLRISVDPLRPGEIVEIDKKEIVEQRLHDSSPMPQGLLDSFTLNEIADLLAFLER